ncbi:MAG: M48 family metalloprotease [Candidatus Omnitrophica bacterium]|nr:M48 family metalloprotease [Candidatus Omnitrophota bacterium]MBU2250823.1 M48 family metalloprotease [Candidatus Omnitrophota bacterium]MBU2265571.1 M48 family metalloprotease [Candidatus Omnitrophota bacterium]
MTCLSFRIINFPLLVTCWLLFLCGCISSEYNVGTQTQDIYLFSTEREVAMGRNIAKKIAQEFEISKNPYDLKRLDEVSSKLVEFTDRTEISYYFYVIEKDDQDKSQVNAFALPGGYIYIFKELFDLLSDDELAFVLSHEMSHIVSRHSIKRLQALMGYNLLVVASAGTRQDAQFTQGLSFALAQILMGYSREDELNADELAVKYCKLAGFDPKAGIEVQEKLYQENKKETRPLSYFRTHPYTDQRIRRIKEMLHLPLDVDDYINY